MYKTNVRPSKGDYGHIDKNKTYSDYMGQNKPKTVYWRVVTPKSFKLSVLQDHDLVFDNKDCKIRQIPDMFEDDDK